jgi:hypothetical protein
MGRQTYRLKALAPRDTLRPRASAAITVTVKRQISKRSIIFFRLIKRYSSKR